MRVAILGASGFVGKNLMLNLPDEWETYAFFNSSSNFPIWAEKNEIKSGVTFIQQDLSQSFEYPYPEKIPKKFDLCVSLIGNTQKLEESLLPEKNFYCDPLALSGFLKRFSVDKFIYFSSGAVYEGHYGIVSAQDTKDLHPFSAYAVTKRTSEMLLDYFVKIGAIREYLNVRFFGAYGPHQRDEKITTKLINTFFIENSRKIKLYGNGRNLIDMMYVQDTIDWILFASRQKLDNKTIDFGMVAPITIKELVVRVANICGAADPIIEFDAKTAPKEDYHFSLGDSWLHPKIPFEYEFKVELEKGIGMLKDWLVTRGEKT